MKVAGGSAGRRVSYPYFKAFNQMLGNMDLFRNVMEGACAEHGQITQGRVTSRCCMLLEMIVFYLLLVELLRECQKFPQITPLQVSLLFDLCSVDQPTGYVHNYCCDVCDFIIPTIVSY